ncbi:serine hydrolase domain-containing protein [Streptomyces sp. NPDC053048]|uniref:serine hydrolase domain-containing protein n=1 Tax=Streptomyces sp. NPDC053048 TaxID=3365694 RepID=UPI0037D90DD9
MAAAVTLTTAFTPSASAAADPSKRGHAVTQAALEEQVRAGHPGVLAQVRDGNSVWNGSAGVADLESGRKRLPEDHFRIGSITKAFTSVAVLQLEGEGKLDIDDTVEHLLPGVVRGNGYDGRKITLRQLLNHSSGIYDYSDDQAFQHMAREGWPEHRYDAKTPNELVAMGLSNKPYFEPGAGWHYSNTNYVLAGLIIEKVTGRTYASEIERRVIKPLGLRATSLPGSSTKMPEPHGRAYSKLLSEDPDAKIWDTTEITNTWVWAAGEIISTPGDVNRFLGALLGGKLLPAKQQQELLTTVPTGEPGLAYGLGLYKYDLPCGGFVWTHGGGVHGSSSEATSSPDGRHTMVFNANGDWARIEAVKVLEAEYCGTPPPTQR